VRSIGQVATSRWGQLEATKCSGRPDAVGCGSRRVCTAPRCLHAPRLFRAARIADQIQRDHYCPTIRQEVEIPDRIGDHTRRSRSVAIYLTPKCTSAHWVRRVSRQSIQALQHAAGLSHPQLAQMIKVSIPQLHFIYDVSVRTAPGSPLTTRGRCHWRGRTPAASDED
jgi:hypothetical protein